MSKFAHCPVCMFREIIEKGKVPSDYVCPRHNEKCISSGEKTNLGWQG